MHCAAGSLLDKRRNVPCNTTGTELRSRTIPVYSSAGASTTGQPVMLTIGESCVRGFHVYKGIWTPTLHECLQTRQELGNPEDEYAIAVCKADAASLDSRIVGHVPRGFSRLYFLQNDGEITGSRRRSPLVKGSLEIPYSYIQVCRKEETHTKLGKLLIN